VSLALLGLALGLAVVGCGKSEAPRNDMPIKTSSGVDKKGKKSRTGPFLAPCWLPQVEGRRRKLPGQAETAVVSANPEE
jgi:hypothetical protein